MKTKLLLATIGCVFFASALHAQTAQGSMGGMMGGSQSSSFNQNGGQQAQKTASADAITSIAPPYDVDDVLRMHRVGLQDVVIINALQARYHPLVLSNEDKQRLRDHGVSEAVIYALEDPFNIGLENVRAQAAEADGGPQIAPRPDNTKWPTLMKRSGETTAEQSAAEKAANQGSASTPASSNPIVGESHPTQDATIATAFAYIPKTSRTNPGPTQMVVSHPSGPGIYIRRGATWERVEEEPVGWSHRRNDPMRSVEGIVPMAASRTIAYPGGGDFLVIVKGNESVIQYQLLHLRQKGANRVFKPAEPGAVYTSAGMGDLVKFDPERLGPSSWLVSLRDLPAGDYGFLPPVDTQLKSTTDLSRTLYTFHLN